MNSKITEKFIVRLISNKNMFVQALKKYNDW